MRSRVLSTSVLLMLAVLLPSALRAAPTDAEILRDCVNPLWLKMNARDPADDPCVMGAKQLAQTTIFQEDLRRGFKRALVAMIRFAAELAKAFGIPGDKAAKLFAIYTESETEEQFAEKLGEFLTGEVGGQIGRKLLGDGYFEGKAGSEAAKALYRRIRGMAPSLPPPFKDRLGSCDVEMTLSLTPGAAEGAREVRLEVKGDCHCRLMPRHGVTMGTFSVTATAPLEISGDPNVPCRLGQIAFAVETQCPCTGDAGLPPPPGVTPTEPETLPEPEATETPEEEDDISRRCDSLRIKYEQAEADYNEALGRALAGDRASAKRADRLAKTSKQRKAAYCSCLKTAYARARKPLPDWVRRLCDPQVVTEPPRTQPVTPVPEGPAGGTETPADPCKDQREAYDRARQKMADVRNERERASAQLELVSAHRDFCRCLRRTAPKDVWEKFCRWNGRTAPPEPPPLVSTGGGTQPQPTVPPQATPEPTATRTPTATATPSPSRTQTPPPPPETQKCALNGERQFRFKEKADPYRHARIVNLRQVMLLQLIVLAALNPGPIELVWLAYQIEVLNTFYNPMACTWQASGIGNFAGRVAVRWAILNMVWRGYWTGEFHLGLDGTLPGGPIIYYMEELH